MKSIVCGITGGIASGKSTVATTFEKYNIPNVDADVVAHDVVAPGTVGLQSIINSFGSQYLNSDGTLNRKELGSFVFQNTEALAVLNSIMSPLIQNEVSFRINILEKQGYPVVLYNAALICEMGNADKYRPLIVVHCTLEQQLERLMKRGTGHGPLTREEAMRRIEAQMPTQQKIAMADFVIDTSGTIENSIQQTEKIIEQLKNLNE